MVDFSAMALGETLDQRDLDRLWVSLMPIQKKALSIEKQIPVFLGTRATIPTQKSAGFHVAIKAAKDALDQLAEVNLEAQNLVAAFVPEYPTCSIVKGGDA